jgi:hypothetical protein
VRKKTTVRLTDDQYKILEMLANVLEISKQDVFIVALKSLSRKRLK